MAGCNWIGCDVGRTERTNVWTLSNPRLGRNRNFSKTNWLFAVIDLIKPRRRDAQLWNTARRTNATEGGGGKRNSRVNVPEWQNVIQRRLRPRFSINLLASAWLMRSSLAKIVSMINRRSTLVPPFTAKYSTWIRFARMEICRYKRKGNIWKKSLFHTG